MADAARRTSVTLYVRGHEGVPLLRVDPGATVAIVLREILKRGCDVRYGAAARLHVSSTADFYLTHNGKRLDADAIVRNVLHHEATLHVHARMSIRVETTEAVWLQRLSWLEDSHRRGLGKLAQALGFNPRELWHWQSPWAGSARLTMSRILLGACDCGPGTLRICGPQWSWSTALGCRLPGLGYAHLALRTTDIETIELFGLALRVVLRPRPTSLRVARAEGGGGRAVKGDAGRAAQGGGALEERFLHPDLAVAAELEAAAAAAAVSAASAHAASAAADASAQRLAAVGSLPRRGRPPAAAARTVAVAAARAKELATTLAVQAAADADDAAKAAEQGRTELLLVCAGPSDVKTMLFLLGPEVRFVDCSHTIELMLRGTHAAAPLLLRHCSSTDPTPAVAKPWFDWESEAPVLLPVETFSHARHTAAGWLDAVPRALKLDALRLLPPFPLLELPEALVVHVLADLDPRELGSLTRGCRVLGRHVRDAAAERAARLEAPKELRAAAGGRLEVELKLLWRWERAGRGTKEGEHDKDDEGEEDEEEGSETDGEEEEDDEDEEEGDDEGV